MGKPLSLDLRARVVAMVAGGASRREAASHFKVSAASAVRWCQLQEATGNVAPKKQGGDQKSQRVEAEAEFILVEVAAKPDLTLEEIQGKLCARGGKFALSTISRFFQRHDITFKKRRRTPPSSSAPM
jgi:transposase